MAKDQRSVRERVRELVGEVLTEAECSCKEGDAVRTKRPHFMDVEDVEMVARERWKDEYGDSQYPAAKRAIVFLVTLEKDPVFVWRDCEEPIARMMRNKRAR